MEESPCAGRRPPERRVRRWFPDSRPLCSRRGLARFASRGGGVVRPLGEGQAVRTLFGVGLVLACCLGLAGCSLFGKKKDTADATPRNCPGAAVARNDVAPPGDPGPAPGANGLLAGEIRDS